jgi:predicted GIY-YIG superfamily endonuclease
MSIRLLDQLDQTAVLDHNNLINAIDYSDLLSFTSTTNLATACLEAARAAAELTALGVPVGRLGVVYLLHFDRPYVHARHYTGFATDLDARLAKHAAGRGARLLEVVKDAGIGWRLARTWPGTRATERALKRQGGASRRCPLCGIHPRTYWPGRSERTPL